MTVSAKHRFPVHAETRETKERRSTQRRKNPELARAPFDPVDESLEETFPASDPPSWMTVKRVGSPR